MPLPIHFRSWLLAAPALLLGGCVTSDFADGYGGGYTPPPVLDKKPGDDGYRDAYMIGASGDYDWIDRADNFARAIGRAEPDFTFGVGDSPIWAWESGDGELLLVEPKGNDVLQYFFAPGGQLYLTRSATRSYGYDRGIQTVSYDVAGRLDQARGWDGDEATDLFVRGQQLLSAYRDYRRFGRGSYAANRAYGYNGGYAAWDSYVLVAPYAPSLDSGWGRGWQPRWRNRPDWNNWRRDHPSRDHGRWDGRRPDDRPDAGGLSRRDTGRPMGVDARPTGVDGRPAGVNGRHPDGTADPAGGWTGRGQGAGRRPDGDAGSNGGAVIDRRVPPPGAPAFRRDRQDDDDGARNRRGGDSWSGPVTAGDRAIPARPAPRPPIIAAPPPPDLVTDGNAGAPPPPPTPPPPPARPRRDREGFDSPVVDRPAVDQPVIDRPAIDRPVIDRSPMDQPLARVPLPPSDVPSPRYDPPPRAEPPPPPPPQYRPPPQDEPVAAATATNGSDGNTDLRPD